MKGASVPHRPVALATFPIGFLVISLIAYSCATNVAPENPENITRLQTIKTVAVIAPDVQLVRRVLGGAEEPMREQDMQAASNLTGLVDNKLSSLGYRVKQGVAAEQATSNIQSVYDQISYEQKYELEHPTLRSTSNLGAAATGLGKQSGAEAVVTVKLMGYRRSGGSIAGETAKMALVTAATGGIITPAKEPNGAVQLGVTFVDSKTGDVLWSNSAYDFWIIGLPDFGPDDLDKLVTKVFANFPR